MTSVVVTSRQVQAGQTLTAKDLRVTRIPTALAPTGSLDHPSQAAGKTCAVTLPQGIALVPAWIGSGNLMASAPRGTVVAPITLPASVARVLRPGTRVDLLSGGEKAARRVAKNAMVLPYPADSGQVPADDDVTLVAVTPAEATALAAIGDWSNLTAVIVR